MANTPTLNGGSNGDSADKRHKPSSTITKGVDYLRCLLAVDGAVHVASLREVCFYTGCTDEPGVRAACWRLLLQLTPVDKRDWATSLGRHRDTYESYVRTFVTSNEGDDEDDHPLSGEKTSHWNDTYVNDQKVLDQIHKDCERLYPSINFFQKTTAGAVLKKFGVDAKLSARIPRAMLDSRSLTEKRFGTAAFRRHRALSNDVEPSPGGEELCETHWEVCERILFVYHKLNPGTSYIQGMNELLGPVYYVLANDRASSGHDFVENAEADAFFCFQILMSKINDFFIRELDHSKHGIRSWLKTLMDTLRHCDAPLHDLIVGFDIRPEQFAFRWATILFTHELQLPEILRLWDSLFSAPVQLKTFLGFVCVGYVHLLRKPLLDRNDYSASLQILTSSRGSDNPAAAMFGAASHPSIHAMLDQALHFFNEHKQCCAIEFESL